jgi:LPS export ABC transporter permease LptG/LPS export ABC transporter permease LptF
MLRTIDRYVIREVLAPFAIVLLVFTFMLLMGPIMDVADQLIAKHVAWGTVLRVLPTLLPSALAVTIPMALLVGLLVALGRLSEDREWVALQACGVSVYRLIRPVATLAVLGWIVTSYVMIYALPDANQAYNEIMYSVLLSKAESQVKPRTFFQELQPKVLYVRDVGRDGAWKDVFLSDPGRDNAIYVARSGRMVVDPTRRVAQLVLEGVTQHTGRAENYAVDQPENATIQLDPATVFPPPTIAKGYNQKTIAELEADIRRLHEEGLPAVEEPMAIQQKFSIPIACLVFALIGLALGVSSRRDGKMASFVLGIGIIFAYYVLMYGGTGAAQALVIPPWSARWIPNVILGPLGVALLVWRARFSEREIPIPFLARVRAAREDGGPAARERRSPWHRAVIVVRLPRLWLPRPRILDWYISKLYLRVTALTAGGLLAIFYIADFIELSSKVFKGAAKPGSVALYFLFKTPYFLYFIIPIAGLIAALVTFGLLTRNSELIVMKACGISLYRAAVPLLAFAVLSGSVLFGLEEKVLAPANRQWKRYRMVFNGIDPDRADMLNRGWVVSRDGRSIYHYDAFRSSEGKADSNLYQFSAFTFDADSWRMTSHLAASLVSYSPALSSKQGTPTWIATNGWMREFPPNLTNGQYSVFKRRTIDLEPPAYFGNEQPDAERMNYADLRRYIEALRAGGFTDTRASVQLQTKIAFPFVALIMTLIAVPFAVTMGRRGAMYGIGLGVVLAITYWVSARVFEAFGVGGALAPALAAWAPNILFGVGAIYLLLTVRT